MRQCPTSKIDAFAVRTEYLPSDTSAHPMWGAYPTPSSSHHQLSDLPFNSVLALYLEIVRGSDPTG